MRAFERRGQIEQILRSYGPVSVDDLARRLGVTSSTIRRDLSKLDEEGKVTRTYGGARGDLAPFSEPSLYERARRSLSAKDAIGSWAAAQVAAGETVILDAGTTTARVARHLREVSQLTVVTNSLTALLALADAENVELIGLGGAFRHISHGFVGPLTELVLARLSADKLFLGADGLVAGRGICEASPDQTRIKELMIGSSRQVYVVADATKLGEAPFHAWAPLERDWTLVTDERASEEVLRPFRKRPEVTVVLAPSTPGAQITGG